MLHIIVLTTLLFKITDQHEVMNSFTLHMYPLPSLIN